MNKAINHAMAKAIKKYLFSREEIQQTLHQLYDLAGQLESRYRDVLLQDNVDYDSEQNYKNDPF
jgi:hypothetical protein